MRTGLILPLALAAAAAGCRVGSEGTEQAALGVSQRDSTLQRDLTLQAAAPEVAVASPVELGRKPSDRPKSASPRRARQPAPSPEAVPTEGGGAITKVTSPPPVTAPTEFQPVTLAPSEAEPPDPHALPPGRSVTVIPASTGSGTDDGWTHVRPAGRERGVAVGEGPHGDGCKPRGTGRMPGANRPGAFR